jgi:adenylate cyclase
MADARVERRLAAILAADVAGYSRLMGVDELGTLAALKAYRREVVDPAIAAHHGRIVKTTGDGMLVEFASAVDAVTCAITVQVKMTERNVGAAQKIAFRIGINVGDIIVDDDDIFGDGVNVAARVENECEPGSVCISGSAFEQVRGKTDFAFDDLGERSLKNIDRPVRLYAVRPPTSPPVVTAKSPDEGRKPLPLPDKPSIAVLPFENMSGDPEQEYFADGMVEEIITALSRFKWLFVIARNSSFTFKSKAVDIKEVGRRLGVRYVLEGSVRKASGKVRITGQLIDAVAGAHLWADRFERDLTDVFALQDEVTIAVVSAIQPKLLQTEIAMATRRRPENLTAYDFYLRARQQFSLATREGSAEAIRLARRALELDPQFAFVAALAGFCHMQNVIFGYAIDPQFDRKEAVRLHRLALSIDDSDPEILAWVSMTSAYVVSDLESAIEIADRAVALNANSFDAWYCRGWVYRNAGLPEEALRSFECAMRMSPLDPLQYRVLAGMGLSFIELGRFDEAIIAGKKALRQKLSFAPTYRCLASAFAHLGRDAEAHEAAARVLEFDPGFTVSTWIARGGMPNLKLLTEGLRKAGLPE